MLVLLRVFVRPCPRVLFGTVEEAKRFQIVFAGIRIERPKPATAKLEIDVEINNGVYNIAESDGRYCLTITCTQNLKGVAAKRELFGQFFNPDGSRKDMTPQQEMEKILADIKKAKEIFSCAPAQNADAAVTTAENAVPTATAATPTISESGADASASTPATSLQNCESAPAASAGGSSVSTAGATNCRSFISKKKD